MKILSIDPGIGHSGVVLLSVYLHEYGNVTTPLISNPAILLHFTTKSFYELQTTIAMLATEESAIIIMEEPPSKGSAVQSEFCHLLLGSLEARKLERIEPAQWKPLARAREWKFTAKNSVHEQDAYNMMRWWLLAHWYLDIGDIPCRY